MDNVRNIRRDKNLLWILDEDNANRVCSNDKTIAVIAYLYYVDDIKYYFEMLQNVPSYIDIYVISSVEEVKDLSDMFWKKCNRNNVGFILKRNRGRDISALLISSLEIFRKYEYVCYLHDKKEKRKEDIEFIHLWIENLWTNMIASPAYIENIIEKFESNLNLGLLVPPEPIGNDIAVWYGNGWGKNYLNACELVKELGLNCNIDEKISPITIGTVFWCRTVALKKLFDKKWEYEDFPAEPLAWDGTISHAIERILAYVAQDAGYHTGTVMTKNYAAKQTLILQEQMTQTFQFLKNEFSLHTVKEIKIWISLKYFAKKEKVMYLYGAGIVAKYYLEFFNKMSLKPKGIIVSQYDTSERFLNGIPIIEFKDFKEPTEIGILVAVGKKNKKAVIENIQNRGYHNIYDVINE